MISVIVIWISSSNDCAQFVDKHKHMESGKIDH